MRRLFFLILFAGLAYAGYWFVGATAKETAIDAWLADRRSAGWVADREELVLTGFPNRFDTILKGLKLADPVTGWSWDAPEFQILALSYKPNHIIAVWPGQQTIASPREKVSVQSETMRGSVRFAVNTQLALEQAIVELGQLRADSSLGWHGGLADGQLAIRRAPPGGAPDYGYDVSLTAELVTLPQPIRDRLDPAGLFPAHVATAEARLTPVWDRPWDRKAVEGPPPELTELNIARLGFTWGGMDLLVRGNLKADEWGWADGKLNITAKNWEDMLAVGVNAGWVPRDMSEKLANGLRLMAQVTGDSDQLDVTLTFSDGEVWFGLIPLGPAPQMSYRQ